MIIDAHQHVFWHGRNDKGLIADMDEHGIDQAWILTWEIPPDEDWSQIHDVFNPALTRADGTHPGMPLSDAIIARDRFPDRFILGYCPPPRPGNAAKLFEAAVRMHGVRVCGEWKYRMLIDDPRCIELFRKAGELKCPVVLHLDVPYLCDKESGAPTYYPRWYGGTIDNLERVLRACPETTFLGHAPGFWREISGDAGTHPDVYPRGPLVAGGRLSGLLDAHPNLYADMSAGSARFAMQRDPEYTAGFICRHADRVLFARDYFGNDLHEFLKTLALPQDVQAKMYSGNAQRLLAQEEAQT